MTRSFRPCPSVLQKSEEHTESRRNIDRDKPRQHSITAYAGEREGEITWNSEPDISHKKKPNPVSCSCFHYIACNFLVLNAALHVFLLFIIDASSLFSVVFRVGELREWCNCRERRSSRPRLSSMRHNIYANAYFRPTTMTFWEFNCVIHYNTRTNTHTHTPRQTDNKLFLNTEKLFAAFFIEQECFFSFRILFKASNATTNNNNSLYFDFIGIQMRRARQNITCLALYTVAPVIQTYITAHEPKHSLMLLRRNAT